jgi:hypothetical protein
MLSIALIKVPENNCTFTLIAQDINHLPRLFQPFYQYDLTNY